MRPAVRELSPQWLARRLPAEWDSTGRAAWESVRRPRFGARHAVWRHPLVFGALVAVSLLLGVLSHIVWDAFTHEGRWGLALIPALDEQWGRCSDSSGCSTARACSVSWCWGLRRRVDRATYS
nr:DUF4184 family protein [Microbacterium sp. NIBRBAC000506063]